MGTYSHSGIDIHFDDIASGPAIILGHSFLCSGEMWTHQLGMLSARHRVINVDLPGHGESGPADRPLTLEDLTDQAVGVLDHLHVDKAIWCGLSIGGMTALRAALFHPERVSALMLLDTDAGAEGLYRRVKYHAMALGARAFGMRSMLPFVNPAMFARTTLRGNKPLVETWGEKFAAVHQPTMRRILTALTSRADLTPQLGRIACPALVLVGEEDASLPPERAERLAAGLAQATLVRVPHAGHLSALEQPEAVNRAISEFLEKIEA